MAGCVRCKCTVRAVHMNCVCRACSKYGSGLRIQAMSESESSTCTPARRSGQTSDQRPACPLSCMCSPSAQKRPAPAARSSSSVSTARRLERPTMLFRPTDRSWRAQFRANLAAPGSVKVATTAPACECRRMSSTVGAKDCGISLQAWRGAEALAGTYSTRRRGGCASSTWSMRWWAFRAWPVGGCSARAPTMSREAMGSTGLVGKGCHLGRTSRHSAR